VQQECLHHWPLVGGVTPERLWSSDLTV